MITVNLMCEFSSFSYTIKTVHIVQLKTKETLQFSLFPSIFSVNE